MQNSAPAKLLAALTALIVVLVIALHFQNPAPPEKPSSPALITPTNHFNPPQMVAHTRPTPLSETPPELDDVGQPKIPREKVEDWLAKHNRNAMSLLAAFRALDDTNYLKEAATNFPNNPQVELAVLARDEFPQDRRKWLDLFKNSSPSNSLANYLSAHDYFQNGNPDAALQELTVASGKSQFESFQTESRLDEEDLYSASGYSQLQSSTESMAGVSQEDLPELATYKQLAQEMGDLQKKYLNSTDANSAANLAQMGLAFGNQIESGDSGKYLINQLVGMAVEANSLRQLDQNTSYDFLNGQTPAQVLQQLKDQKTTLKELSSNASAAYPLMTQEEMVNYAERIKIYGETAAQQWLIQQHPTPTSQKGSQ